MNGDNLVAQWREEADQDNPAGELFTSGEFAEADIVSETKAYTSVCGTGCTYSRTRYCC